MVYEKRTIKRNIQKNIDNIKYLIICLLQRNINSNLDFIKEYQEGQMSIMYKLEHLLSRLQMKILLPIYMKLSKENV